MNRYYFDVRDQDGVEYDEIGLELAGLEAARREAWRALGELMLEGMTSSGRAAIAIDIRIGDGRTLVEVVAASDDRDRS